MTPEAPRKVLFISADQWRGECLSLLGHPTVKTPNLDALAAEGVCFRRHYTQAAPCGPSRTSLLTGLYLMNHRSGRNGTPLDARHSNLALEVRKGGYDPTLFGYTDTSPDPRRHHRNDPLLTSYENVMPGFTVGFQYNESRLYSWLYALKERGYPIPAHLPDIYQPVKEYPGSPARGHSFPPPVYKAEDSDTAFTADKVLEYLDFHRHEPWFVHAVFLRPHPPLYAPEPYNSLYDPDTLTSPARRDTLAHEAAQHPFLAHWLDTQGAPGSYTGHPLNVRDLPDHELKQLRATYYSLITEVDHHIGRLIAHLKATGEYDNTLIIFTVDHGEMLGDHWLFGKGGYFDASYHIPLIIRDPRHAADSGRGRVVERFTEAVDLLPTVLDWLGLEIPLAADGESLLPFLEGATPGNWRTEVHWEYDFRDIADQQAEQALGLSSDQCTLNVIRDERYKYVHFVAQPPLFFDLSRDPGEFENRAADPAYQALVLEYAQKLLSWRMLHAERTLARSHLTAEGVVTRPGPRRPA